MTTNMWSWLVNLLILVKLLLLLPKKSSGYNLTASIDFQPMSIVGLRDDRTANITFIVTITSDNLEPLDEEHPFVIKFFKHQPNYFPRDVVKFASDYQYELNLIRKDSQTYRFESVLSIAGNFLGFSNISSRLYNARGVVEKEFDQVLSVSVIRSLAKSHFDTIFRVVIITLVSINYINMGCHLDLGVVREALRTPVGPIIGFLCQFTIMPVGSYIIGWLLLSDANLRLGLFTLGCCPGGSSSNFWTLLFDGDISLSITMTFISTVAALGMMPIWLFSLGQTFNTEASSLKIPYANLFISMVSFTIPLLIGVAIARLKPSWAKISGKIIRPFTIFVVALAISTSIIFYNFIFLMFTWRILLACGLVAITGYSLGAFFAVAARLKRAQVIAISIETAYQNGGIAFIILLLSLDQPNADIASVPVLAQLLLTGQPLWLVLAVVKLVKWVKKRNEVSWKEKNEVAISNGTVTYRRNLEAACYDGPAAEKNLANGQVDNTKV